VELETDKITVEVPSITGGVLSKQHYAEGATVHTGEVLADLDESRTAAAEPRAAPAPPTPEPRASPAAKRLAAQANVELATIPGTGRGGVVSKPDVVEALRSAAAPRPAPLSSPAPLPPPAQAIPPAARPVSAPPASERETREKMSTRRKRIAENLLQAQHATAHLTTFNEIDMSALIALRGRVKDRVEKERGVRLSFMPFFVKASCQAIAALPVVNAQVDGDSIIYKHYVHIGIAVATDAGLVVPSVKDAHQKGVVQIARETAELAARAREGKLTMDDLTGGTFTITNGGVFGSLLSTPIINYPQVAILGLHKIQDRAVVVDGQITVRPMMYVALSYDHRIVDGEQAVLFLVRIKELIEEPAAMLIE